MKRKDKMQIHLVKCQRNHPDARLSICPFNTTHRVQEPELKHHIAECPDRLLLDKFIHKPEDVQGAEVRFPIPKLDLQPTESWDDVPIVPTYNPEEHCKNNPILRNSIHTQSAAKRRNFRLEERARMQQFDSDTSTFNKTQELGLEATQKQRRPAAKSAGIRNDEHNKLDISDIMQEIKLNADVLTTPKIPNLPQKPKNAHKPATYDDIENVKSNEDFPSLTNDLNNPGATSAPWSAATLAMNGIALNQGATKRSRGRGSFLAKKD